MVYDEDKQDNDVIDPTGVVYVKIGIQLSLPIKQNAVYHENHTGK